jgi:hypothetical protein
LPKLESPATANILVDITPALAVWKSIVNKYYVIGDPGSAGGIVFYVTDGGLHGLEVAPIDQDVGAEWGCFGTLLSGADGIAIGTGAQNTEDIADGCSTAGIVAVLALDFTLNGYDDWFLPSQD